MREADLRALHRYRARRRSAGKPSVLIPNLLKRQFTATRPNTAWVTDITYIRTWQGWLYLAVVMDLFSRMIVGCAAGPVIHGELVLNAVLTAVRRRRPRGTLIYSDQETSRPKLTSNLNRHRGASRASADFINATRRPWP
jgi:putative transposase